MVLKFPNLLETQHTPYQIPQWKDPQPHFCTKSPSESRFWTQYRPVPSSPSPLPQPWPHWHDQVAIPRDQGCDTQILLPASWYLLTSLASLHLVACLRGQVGGAHYLPLLTHKLNLPNPHIKNILSNFGHVPHNYFYSCLDPWYYVDF